MYWLPFFYRLTGGLTSKQLQGRIKAASGSECKERLTASSKWTGRSPEPSFPSFPSFLTLSSGDGFGLSPASQRRSLAECLGADVQSCPAEAGPFGGSGGE